MKRLYILLLTLTFIIPLNAKAAGYYIDEHNIDGLYFNVEGAETAFCVDPGIPAPAAVEGPQKLDWNDSQERAYIGAYRYFLAAGGGGDSEWMQLVQDFKNGTGSGLAYCAGVVTAGMSGSVGCEAQLGVAGYDPRFLKYSASEYANFYFVADNTEHNEDDIANGIYKFKVAGPGVIKMKELIDPSPKNNWRNLTASIVVNSCKTNKTGYSCSIYPEDRGKNLLADTKNQFRIQITRNGSTVYTATELNIELDYSYIFPFGQVPASDIRFYKCGGPVGEGCDDWSIKYRACAGPYYRPKCIKEEQRERCRKWTDPSTGEEECAIDSNGEVIMEKYTECVQWGEEEYWRQRPWFGGWEPTAWPEVSKCNRGTGGSTQRLMATSIGSSNGKPEYGAKYVRVILPASCSVQRSGNTKIYYVGGSVVTLENYIKAGCCKDIDKEDIETEPEREAFRKECMEEDIVNLENACGERTKLGTKEYALADGRNISLPTCENESYVDYTHSYVWQVSMDKILARINQKEDNKYFYNINGSELNKDLPTMWNDTNSGFKEYSVGSYNYSYLHQAISGKNGASIPGISPENNYCMLLTSETNDIYFPGTAVATSGRFFVFNELSKEECANAMNPGPNCFRQPHIVGGISAAMHTNFDKWDRDYRRAIEREKNFRNAGHILYQDAKLDRELLEKYKSECESRNNLSNYWEYTLMPDLTFSYTQKVYGGQQRSEVITENVKMEISDSGVKYWPNASTEVSCTYSNSGGGNVTYSTGKTFSSTKNYIANCTRTVYFRPEKVTYATIPDGQYKTTDINYQTDRVEMIENGLMVGYVYNVRLTAYEGAYVTSFDANNLGNRMNNYTTSALQNIIDNYKKENNITKFSSECVYCNQEGEFSRVCDVCPDPENPDLGVKYIYRTISLTDVTPNDRPNTNWSDAKGVATEERIKSLSGDNVVANLSTTTNNEKIDAKVKLLGEVDSSSDTQNLAKGNIYNDYTREFLEYEITLTTSDMQLIKANSENRDFDYSKMNMCTNSLRPTDKGADTKYCFVCNEDGKECESSFVDAYSDSATTLNTRKTKWKYYLNGKWEIGNWNNVIKGYTKLEGFESGRYPDPLNQDKFLEVYSNWP